MVGAVVTCVIGTRPEAVKMAPVIARLRDEVLGLNLRIVTTGQHRGLLDQALADFDLMPDVDLDLMRPGQGLAELTSRSLKALDALFATQRPDLVLSVGDTTTVLSTALACYYRQVPFGHIEAGLRTGDPLAPFPEEKHREVAARLATLHFAPTEAARANLIAEGINPAAIHLTGNTAIDALQMVARRTVALPVRPSTKRFALVTTHRRENFGAPLAEICQALVDLLDQDQGLSVVLPIHPNPAVRPTVEAYLAHHPRAHLIEPVGYAEFVALMKASWIILTDSGGIQEEAPSLGKRVLVLREATERPEGVTSGGAQVVGSDRQAIRAAVERLRDEPDLAAPFFNPFGDGHASDRIARVVARHQGCHVPTLPPGVPEVWEARVVERSTSPRS